MWRLALGALGGGYIAPHLPSILGYQLRTLFTLSGALRAVAVVLVLGTIVEVRHVPKIGTLSLLLGRMKPTSSSRTDIPRNAR